MYVQPIHRRAAAPGLAHAARPGTPAGVISEADLVFLREEEKLARDVYLTLHDRWGHGIFASIAESEQRHTSAVDRLLEARGIPDPVVDDRVGAFTDPVIAGLYEALVDLGSISETDALVAGATIEDMDILDITEMLHRTDAPDVIRALEALRSGSHSHARAFHEVLVDRGVIYVPQYTAQAEWDAVLAATSASCP